MSDMKTRTLCITALLALLAGLVPPVWPHADPPPVDQAAVGEKNAFLRYTLPAGTPLHVLLQSPLSTKANQVSDPVDALMAQTLYMGETVMIPENTFFRGKIVNLEPPVEGRNAVLEVRFHTIYLPDGERLPIEAYVKTERADHAWGGELTPGTEPKRVTHRVWGIGGYNQIILAGPRAMGQHIGILPGERWTLILEKPLVLLRPNPNPQPKSGVIRLSPYH